MLAPRNKLWSTPDLVIYKAVELLEINSDDIIYDIGCGDGRFLISACLKTDCKHFIGIEINKERAMETNSTIKNLSLENKITIVSQNAIEYDFSNATKIFLYLNRRGLKIILPHIQKINHPVTVVTFLYHFQDIKPIVTEKVKLTPNMYLPLYKYIFN